MPRILPWSAEVGVPPPQDGLPREPGFEPLRANPGFARVLVASRDGAAMVARVLGEACAGGELPAYVEAPLDALIKVLSEQRPSAVARRGWAP